MTAFADTSAVVKLYVDEPGADVVRSLGTMYVSALTGVEVASALWRKHRQAELAAESVQQFASWFDDDIHATDRRLVRLDLDQAQLDHAALLVSQHDLRASDAIQLAAALAVRRADPTCDRFACFDQALMAAAKAEGFGDAQSDSC
ncbi:MAG: type II toxin-antitoxin system VapC family toxin [Actinomycetota bacterium]